MNQINSFKSNKLNDNKKEIKYPFNGKAPNLIDKFIILGYGQKTIDFTYQNCNIELQKNLKSKFAVFQFEERPNIINEIYNDYSKELLDNDLIIKIIFPNYPKMYTFEKEILNKEDEKIIEPYSVIFSLSPQDDSDSIKSYNGLGYVFYALQEYKDDRKRERYLYVPTAYIILSEYPYFYQFNEICKNIYNAIKKEDDEIPIDIIIYNTIKFVPSPINKSINLIFGNRIGIRQNDNIDIKKIIFNLYSKPEKDKSYIPSMLFPQLSGYPLVDINMSFIFKFLPPKIIIEAFIFSFLEYSLIVYSSNLENLNMILYLFKCFNYPFNDSIYYQNILSISKSLFMSETSSFIDNTSSTMIGVFSEYDPEFLTTKNIKEHFVLDIDKKKFFFFYQEENDKVEEIINLHSYIQNCIEVIENYSHFDKPLTDIPKDEIHLYDSIKDLMEKLTYYSKKVNTLESIKKINKKKLSFFDLFWYESDKKYFESNKRIQEAFYIFIINIFKNLGLSDVEKIKYYKGDNNFNLITNYLDIIKDFEDISNSRIPSFVDEYYFSTKENQQLSKNNKITRKVEKIIREKFFDNSKFKNPKTIDLYKISYNFFNEFINYSQFKFINLNEIFIFQLIDQFYGKNKLLDLEELTNKNQTEVNKFTEEKLNDRKKEKKEKKVKENDKKQNITKKEKQIKLIEENNKKEIDFILNSKEEDEGFKNLYLFSFDNFSDYYQKNLRILINREQEDDKENFSKVKSINRLYKRYKRNNYFLSRKILNIYMTFANNNLKELLKTFELIKWTYKKPLKDMIDISEENSLKNINNNISNNTLLKGFLEKKNEEKEELYLIQNKSNKYEDLKEKIFGTYHIIEIENVIENLLIIQRSFSPYALIKYSLLNVLEVTRMIKSKIISNQNVIQIICDFCDLTEELKIKKYMNIYLNIFKIIQQKNLREKLEIEECINKIYQYLKTKNIILTEENDINSNGLQVSLSDKSSMSENEDFLEFIRKEGKFFERKNAIFISNIKEFQNVLKAIESIYLGDYEKKIFDFNYDSGELTSLYKENEINNNRKFIPKTPILLYDSTNKILKNYLNNIISNENIPYNELYNDILSLLFYFKMPDVGYKWIEKRKKENNKRKEKIKISETENNKNHKIEKEALSKNDENFIIKDNKKMHSSKEIDVKNDLNEILKKIIAILYDLINNIKEKFK